MHTQIGSTCKALLSLLALLLLPRFAAANLCGEEDRVLLREGSALETAAIALSAEEIEPLMRSIYSVHKATGALKKFKPCTGVAISPHWILLAHHCFEKNEAIATQKHIDSPTPPIELRKFVRSDQEMIDWLKTVYAADPAGLENLELIEDQKHQLLSIFVDFAIFERVEGEFEQFISPDFAFEFSEDAVKSSFAVVGLPVLGDGMPGLGQKQLWFSPATSLAYDDPPHYSERGKAEIKLAKARDYPETWDREEYDDRPPAGHSKSLVSFCSDLFKGNSGSPLVRFERTDGELETRVIAVVSMVIPDKLAAEFPNVAATPLSFVWIRRLVEHRTGGQFEGTD